MSKTLWGVLIGGALVLWARSRPLVVPVRNINDTPNVSDWGPWWAIHATGMPSVLGSNGTGVVTPGTLTSRMGSFFGGTRPYLPPNAGTTLLFMKPASPAGSSPIPGVRAPGTPTTISPVQGSGPTPPPILSAPVSANPWLYEVSLTDPVAAWWGGGSMIDSRILLAGGK